MRPPAWPLVSRRPLSCKRGRCLYRMDTGFGEIKEASKPIYEQLNRNHLNELPGLDNPTSENLAKWILERAEAIIARIIPHSY